MKPAETDGEDGGAGVPGDRECWGERTEVSGERV